MTKRKTKFNSGFSLVETLVAIFILAMAVAAAMTVAQNSLQASFYARDRIAAFFLAQEAIELIKNRRDVNVLSGNRWLQGIADWNDGQDISYGGPCGESDDCGIDIWIPQTFKSCEDIDEGLCGLFKRLHNDSRRGLLVHCPSGTGCGTTQQQNYEESNFSRKINMKEISPNEAEITVTVSWTRGSREIDLVVKEHIFNWHPFSVLEPQD